MTGDARLGPGREFDVIRDFVARWGSSAQGIGDDAAIVDVPSARLVVSTDASIENVHFRAAWLRPEEIGYRAATAALSDLAAMAARPIGVLLAMGVPERWRSDLGAIADGVGAAARAVGAPIVGGNLTDASELSLTLTVLGEATHPLRRTEVRVGDAVYVTGTLGGPRAALAAWLDDRVPRPEHRERFAHPSARVREAQWLAAHGARAAIDVSDGLAADVRHLALASGVRIELELDAVPCAPGVPSIEAVRGGEEYELVITARGPVDGHAFAQAFGLPLTRIGAATAATDDAGVSLRAHGTFVDLPPGHDHFSR